MDNNSASLPDFEKITSTILKQYDDVFKEDLSPQDRIKGVQHPKVGPHTPAEGC